MYYVSGVLLCDNFYMVKIILKTSSKSMELIKLSVSMENFIKGKYEQHITLCDVTEPSFELTPSTVASCRDCEVCYLPQSLLKFFKQNLHTYHH